MGNVSQCAWEIFPSRVMKHYAVGLGNIAQWKVEKIPLKKLEY